MFWYTAASILICLVGLFACLRPASVWTLTERWKSHDAREPSDFYLLTTRIGGALMAVTGLALAVLCCVVS